MKSDTHNYPMGSLAAAIAITVHGSRGLNVFRLRDGNFTFALLFVSSAALNQTMPITCNELHTPQIFTIIAIKQNHHSSISFPKKILKPPLWGLQQQTTNLSPTAAAIVKKNDGLMLLLLGDICMRNILVGHWCICFDG